MVKYTTLLLSLILVGLGMKSCSTSEKPETTEEEMPLPSGESMPDTLVHQQAKKISQEAFAALSGALQKAITEGGVLNAIAVCKTQAMPITNAVGEANQVEVKRIAVRYRNPDNAVNGTEMQLFEDWSTQMARGEEPAAIVLHEGENRIWYGAIRLGNPLCLQCHGQPGKDIAEATLAQLRSSYPDDRATGFALGDLRGAWKITMP